LEKSKADINIISYLATGLRAEKGNMGYDNELPPKRAGGRDQFVLFFLK